MPPSLSACVHCGQALPGATPGQGGLRRFCSEKCRARRRYLRVNHRPAKPCRRCWTELPAGSHANKYYCSRACKKSVDSAAQKVSYPTKYRPRRYSKECLTCGNQYVARRTRSRFCSEACRRLHPACRDLMRNSWNARRARVRGASKGPRFQVLSVLERDGWKCQICGIPTPRELRGNRVAPNAPELDHIIPVSRGGAHSPENTQCACRRCNSRKKNKLPDEMKAVA